MKTFVGYGFNERDKWIEDMIFPIVIAFGDEVIHGKLMPGEFLAEGVKERLKKADIFIGFATRRLNQQTGEITTTTHKWVAQELAMAFGFTNPPPALEVREIGSDPQEGITAGIQYLQYDPNARAEFLVGFVQNYGELRRRAGRFELHLMPGEFTDALAPVLADGNLRCTYQLMDGVSFDEEPEVPTRVVRVRGGLFIRTGNVSRDCYIRVRVTCGSAFTWTSEYQKVDTRMIHLSRQ
jgi:hypothetical protein